MKLKRRNLEKKSTQQTENKKGVIVAHYGVAVDVLFSEDNDRSMIRVKRNSGHVVGDKVIVKEDVLTRLERNSELSRMDARGGMHIVGANLDVLCIVVSCEPLPPPGFIDRAIVSARASNLRPVLIINKSDLPCFAEYQAAIQPVYQESVQIFTLSAEDGTGLETTQRLFQRRAQGGFCWPDRCRQKLHPQQSPAGNQPDNRGDKRDKKTRPKHHHRFHTPPPQRWR